MEVDENFSTREKQQQQQLQQHTKLQQQKQDQMQQHIKQQNSKTLCLYINTEKVKEVNLKLTF